MARAWPINSRGLANKVKNASQSSACPIKDCGANRECPNCHFVIDNSDVLSEWPGLPLGVKFDPSDGELLEHLAAKCSVGNSQPHVFIDEFIPTLEGDNGIYCDHPENLPGAKWEHLRMKLKKINDQKLPNGGESKKILEKRQENGNQIQNNEMRSLPIDSYVHRPAHHP